FLALIKQTLPRVDRETTLLFFYIGHGDVDNRNNDRRRLLLDSEEFLYRDELLEVLNATHPRLLVLLTESCAGLMVTEPPPPVGHLGPTDPRSQLFESLFVTPTGVIDIASSTFSRNSPATEPPIAELSWCPEDGGMFGRAIVSLFR